MPETLQTHLNVLPAETLLHITDSADVMIHAPFVETDSDVHPGGVFIARKGHSVDGHQFIPKALERGAAAIVGEADITGLPVPYVRVKNAQAVTGLLAASYYGFPSRKLAVIGVTGTDGKTTTTHLIHSILQIATRGKAGFISTIAADFGSATADTGLHVTTPGAPQVQMFLANMVAAGLTHAVLEMTSHGLAQGRLNGVELDIAVITNITHEHLDFHGSWEAYRDAKALMFQMPGKTFIKHGIPKAAVINGDDPSWDYLCQKFYASLPAGYHDRTDEIPTGKDNMGPFIRDGVDRRYGIYAPGDVLSCRAVDIEYRPDKTVFNTTASLRDFLQGRPRDRYEINLVGEFNVYNALAAITTAQLLNTAPPDIQQGLAQVKAVSGRMERIDEGQNFTAIVDFAHTPNALEKALSAARQMLLPGKRLIAVFGSAGLRDIEKRRMMAEVSARLADMTVLTAEDPRTESLDDILTMMAQGCISQGGIEGQTFIRVPDRGEAIYRACLMADEGDIVMACGKGHEQSMCFGIIEYPWDDREAMRAALRGTPLKTLPTAQSQG